MSKSIVLMTANVSGGIIQFTFQLYHTLRDLGCAVKVCFPCQLHDSDIDEVALEDRIIYNKVKKVVDKRSYKELADRIASTKPDYIWYCDDSVICSEVGLALNNSGIKQLLTLHDAGGYHPTNHDSIRNKLLHQYLRAVNSFFYKRVHRFVLLSAESQKAFCSRWPKYADASVMMNLGAHIPQVEEEKPPEVSPEEKYLLFFGRIDKYKGIEGLLRAYGAAGAQVLPLVVAGGGALSEEEKRLLATVKNVTLINRYIKDGEMKWLFSHSAAVVLPYIEATQSGIIPIAYAYSKPVLVSDVVGLTQFVVDGKTGIICKSKQQWVEALCKTDDTVAEEMAESIKQYYRQNLDWKLNLERMLTQI